MGRFIDVQGQKFGRLTAIEPVRERDKNGRITVMWVCKCDCGNIVKTSANKLRTGHTRSCGCLQKQRVSESSFKNLAGKRFGRLTAVTAIRKANGGTAYECICECGRTTIVDRSNLTSGATKSCGCYRSEITAKLKYNHGLHHHRLHTTWSNMKDRCYNPKNKEYKRYGGRKITVCDEWKENFKCFYIWAIENGYQDNLTIDRIDNDKGYSPENCQWITLSENIRKMNMGRWHGKETFRPLMGGIDK